MTMNKRDNTVRAGGSTPAAYNATETTDPLPEKPLPNGYTGQSEQGGTGKMVTVSFSGANAATPTLRGMMKDLNGYFDAEPDMLGAVADKQDRMVQAIFAAQIGGVPVRGIAMVFVNEGKGTFGMLFDKPGRFLNSYSKLVRMMEGKMPQQAGGVSMAQVQWKDYQAPDGSCTIKTPNDWVVTVASQGTMKANGPRGENVSVGEAVLVNTPQGALPGAQYIAPYGNPAETLKALYPQMAKVYAQNGMPASQLVNILEVKPEQCPNGQAAFLLVEVEVTGQGQSVRCLALMHVIMLPYDSGTFSFFFSSCSAPTETFKQEFPILMEVWQSWSLSGKLLTERLTSAAESMRQAGEILRSANANTTATYAKVNLAWDQAIRGTATVEHIPSGARGDAEQRAVSELVKRDPVNYREVPISELRP
jgi:hypothetical protein